MNKIKMFAQKHSTLMLSIIASGGVVTTTILAVKATPKAIKILKEVEEQKGSELTTLEKIKYGWEPYLYCGISGISTIICIMSIQYLNSKKQASLISAYTLLENAYNEYQNNIKRICSEDVDLLARQEIVKSKYDDSEYYDEESELFFDYQGMRFFTSSFDSVVHAEKQFLESLFSRGNACLNEWYDYLGLPPVDYGYQLGWSDIETCDPYNVKELEFRYEQTTVGDNVKCWIITTSIPASFDYII